MNKQIVLSEWYWALTRAAKIILAYKVSDAQRRLISEEISDEQCTELQRIIYQGFTELNDMLRKEYEFLQEPPPSSSF